MDSVAQLLDICLAFCLFASTANLSATHQKVDRGEGIRTGKLVHVEDAIGWVRYGRWSALRQHTIHALAQFSENEYCVLYSTTVVDEAQDLQSSQGADLAMELKGKELIVTLHSGRQLKMRLVTRTDCHRM